MAKPTDDDRAAAAAATTPKPVEYAGLQGKREFLRWAELVPRSVRQTRAKIRVSEGYLPICQLDTYVGGIQLKSSTWLTLRFCRPRSPGRNSHIWQSP